MFTRRSFLKKSSLAGAFVGTTPALLGGCSRAQTAAVAAEIGFDDEAPLRVRAENNGRIFGAALTADQLRRDKEFRNAVIRECGMLVQENDLKWFYLQRDGGAYDFRNADYIQKFAQDNGMQVRGHLLLWYRSIPSYLDDLVNKSNAEKIIVDHINKVAGRYAGQMHSWDVVNEAINIKDGLEGGYRPSLWFDALGPDYLDLAFETAAKADPDGMLIYNDYALDYAREQDHEKRAAVLALLKRLKNNNIPIHALGMQSHLNAGRYPFDRDVLIRFFDEVAELGLRIYVTELDVQDKWISADVASRDRSVADEYRQFADVYTTHPAVDAVVTWGLSDRYTWVNEHKPRIDGLPQRSLPLDHKMRRKLAWKALADAFDSGTKPSG